MLPRPMPSPLPPPPSPTPLKPSPPAAAEDPTLSPHMLPFVASSTGGVAAAVADAAGAGAATASGDGAFSAVVSLPQGAVGAEGSPPAPLLRSPIIPNSAASRSAA